MKIRIFPVLLALLILLSPTAALATHGFGSTSMVVYVDEEPFLVYGYNGGDFVMDPSFKLRDIAYILSGTSVQFDITEADDGILDIWVGTPLTLTGTELSPKVQTNALFGSYGRFDWGEVHGFPAPFPTTTTLNVDLWDVPQGTEFVHLRVYGGMGVLDLMADKPNLAVTSFPLEIPFTGIGGATLDLYSVEENGEEVLIRHASIHFPDEAIFGSVTLRLHRSDQDISCHTLGIIRDLSGDYFSLFNIADLLGFKADWTDWTEGWDRDIAVATYAPPAPEPIPAPTPAPTPAPIQTTASQSTQIYNDTDNLNDDAHFNLGTAIIWWIGMGAVLTIVWFVRTRRTNK